MSIFLGIDIGSISAKVSGVFILKDAKQDRPPLPAEFSWSDKATKEGYPIFLSKYHRIHGKPAKTTIELLEKLAQLLGDNPIKGIGITGSGVHAIREIIPAIDENEFKAITLAVNAFYPEARAVFELGGENSKFIQLEKDGSTGALWIRDYGVNGDCAAGTGSFIDQQATRLRYKVEDIGEITSKAKKAASIAGRCSVFAKSDMIHAQQRGYTPEEILTGLMDAVTLNYKANITRGRKIKPPVLLIGGVGQNSGIIRAMKKAFELKDNELIIPKDGPWFASMGAAILASQSGENAVSLNFGEIREKMSAKKGTAYHPRLSTEKVSFLKNPPSPPFPKGGAGGFKVPAYLGIDIGSVSTNVVILSEDGHVIKDIYTRTESRPIEVTTRCLKEVEEELGDLIEIVGVGTTGSGRELVGELVGADTIRDEITAHKTGANHVAKTLTNGEVDTIFEIGGQDSKFISINNGVVVDFAMNEACAAGTGSFLEEQAEKLGIQIKDEFARLALSSEHPLRLGERCTVFMERDVNAYQQKGAAISDICAGLAYSIATNYLNRVVRGRKIGSNIYFQGGTAYNDAVAAAFSKILDKKITVPPHNGVIGAVGAALLAKETMERNKEKTKFHGFNIEKVPYTIREFSCKACSNTCDIQEFTVKEAKTYWGDKCSERYRKGSKVDQKSILPDLFAERQKLLFGDFKNGDSPQTTGTVPSASIPRIGFPRALYFYDRFPFWRAYFETIGCQLITSDETNKKIVKSGLEATVAEPCFPVQVAHGHIKNVWEKGIDFIWLPNTTSAEKRKDSKYIPYFCPWGMTLPFVVKTAPEFEPLKDKMLTPTLRFFYGKDSLAEQLLPIAKKFGASKKQNRRAVEAAYNAFDKFQEELKKAGDKAIKTLAEANASGVVIVGRPYNVHDRSMNLNIPKKLRETYGINVIPYDMLYTDDIKVDDLTDNMFWNYGKKVMTTARYTGANRKLHLIYITNFKCGPDSYVKHYTEEAAEKPYLTIQLDAHSNDAGVMTRIEAYLDSKGLLAPVQPRLDRDERAKLG